LPGFIDVRGGMVPANELAWVWRRSEPAAIVTFDSHACRSFLTH